MQWEECKDAFYVDGSLRDIFVAGTRLSDWDSLLGLATLYDAAFTVDGAPKELPTSAIDALELRQVAAPLLAIGLNGIRLHAHFFAEDEIELDFDPKDIPGQAQLDQLLAFLRQLGQTLGKDVHVTDENTPTAQWIAFSPTSDRFTYLGRRG